MLIILLSCDLMKFGFLDLSQMGFLLKLFWHGKLIDQFFILRSKNLIRSHPFHQKKLKWKAKLNNLNPSYTPNKDWLVMKKALIIGASSGIGKELAITLAKNGYEVGLMARRVDLLEALQKEIPTKTYVGHLDISEVPDAMQKVDGMIHQMGGM